MTVSPLPCLFENSLFYVEGESWIPLIADSFSDYNPKIHNSCKIHVDLSLDSSVDFSLAEKIASDVVKQGGRVFWELYLDIPTQLTQLRFEGIFNAHYQALKIFTEMLWNRFQSHTIGCSIYQDQIDLSKTFKWSEGDFIEFIEWLTDLFKTPHRLFETEAGASPLGQIDCFSELSIEMFEVTPFARHLKNLFTMNIFAAYLHRLAASLPEELLIFINLDTRASIHEGFLYQLLSKERFSHLHLILNEERIPIDSLNFQHKREFTEVKVGVCFPNDPYCLQSVLTQFKKLFVELKKYNISYRVIPEFLMTSTWEGLDEVLFLHRALSSQGKRILQGFSVASGTVVYMDKPIGFEQEISYEEFLRSKKE